MMPSELDINHLILEIDTEIITVNKPSGLLTIRDGYNPDLPHLSGILQKQFGRIWVVHRLDKETSGVVIFARNPTAHRILNQQFEDRQISKEYRAIIFGTPSWENYSCQLPLRINGDRRHRTTIDQEKGKPAQTDFSVRSRYSEFTLIQAFPRSGYTHQIRAHLLHLGFPIVNDSLYRLPDHSTPPELVSQNLCLHAYQIHFIHPSKQTPWTIQAPYSLEFAEILRNLKQVN